MFNNFVSDQKSSQDYYPFGMIMPGRSYSSSDYRFGFNGKEKDDEVKGKGNSLDFGERIYDTRIGRWLAIDKYFTKAPGLTPYRFGFDNPILYSDKEGNFEISAALREKYPRAALLLDNIQTIYNGQQILQELAGYTQGLTFNNTITPKMKDAFSSNSGMNEDQIQNMLAPECGPILNVELLDDQERGKDSPRLVDGYTYPLATDVGIRNWDDKEGDRKGLIAIDDEVMNGLESALGSGNVSEWGGVTMTLENRQQALDAFIVTTFHEGAHYGRLLNGNHPPSPGEPGNKFQHDAYGEKEFRRFIPGATNNNQTNEEDR